VCTTAQSRCTVLIQSTIALARTCPKHGGPPLLSEKAAREQGQDMKPSTKDQVEGTLHEMKGKVKQKAGQVTHNPNLTDEGQAEKLAGKVQKKIGQVKKVFEK
jgi:uncharacterized protein YjbJ (UPF0337 family)